MILPSVLIRSVYRGRVRWALPNLLLESTSERVVTCILPGVTGKAPAQYEHEAFVRQLLEGWEMADHVWHTRRVLTITTLGAAHSLGMHWDHATDRFLGWYVNLQEPLRPTPLGYDTMDQVLDIWIEPDRSWQWKDWDELVEAEQDGLFTPDEADAIRAEGRRVVGQLDGLIPTGWEGWRLDPSVELPTLPEDWDRIW